MIKKSDIDDMYFLSPMQGGMLFHYLMDKGSPAYFEQTSYRVNLEINCRLFEQAFNQIIEKYDVLRTIFIYEKLQQPLQVVLKKRKATIQYEDISYLDEDAREKKIREFKNKDKARGFDLAKDILIRLAILKLANGKHEIVWSFHHIIMDGWCISIIIKDMLLAYNALITGNIINLSPAVPYKNYIKWLEKQDKEIGINYWKYYLEHYDSPAIIPRGIGKKGNKYEFKTHQIRINQALSNEFMRIANENNVTMSTIVQTLWGILLQKYNNTDDVVFGAIVSGRPAELEDIETMVGLFINAIPIRVKVGPGEIFLNLIKKIQAQMIQSRSYEYVPLAEIQSNTLLKNELINHLFIFENYPIDKEIINSSQDHISSFLVENVEIFEQTNYDLNVIAGFMRKLTIKIKYNTAVYKSDIVNQIQVHLISLIQQVCINPLIPVEELEIVSASEKKQLLFDFNKTETGYPENKTIHQLFAEQVEKTPDNIALVSPLETSLDLKALNHSLNNNTLSIRNMQLTYRQLHERCYGLAHLLQEKGVKQGAIVGLILDRSIEMIVGIMGILIAGGAYLPIDHEYPETRISYMLADSNTHLLITKKNISITRGIEKESLYLDNDEKISSDFTNFASPTDPGAPAYVIYTSGTTGKSKGVLIEHRNVVRLMFNDRYPFDFNGSDVWTMFHSYCFDFSVWEMYGALLYGGKLVIISRMVVRDSQKYLKLLEKKQVTVLNQTPSAFYNLAAEELRNPGKRLKLRYVIFGGEALKPGKLEKWKEKYPAVKLVNMFGITETTVHVTYKEIESVDIQQNLSVIGGPIPTLSTYVMDKNLRLSAQGVPGELCVGGDGVGRGYLNRPQLTAEKFIENPYIPGERLYRSGDLVKLTENGQMEYMGRIDHQVKIRGFRIETGEIESVLLKNENISQVVVLAKENSNNDKYLCAYYVSKKELKTSALRDYLAGELPDYMIPSYFVLLENIPLTPNGKLDVKALPEPNIKGRGETYEAPRNEVENILAEIWEEVLVVEKPGINDNFFDSGGHSLNAMTLISNIHKRLNVRIPINELFTRPTIMEISEYIRNTGENIYSSIQTVEKREFYPLSSAQLRLIVLDRLENKNTAYNMPFMVELEGTLDMIRLDNAFTGLIKRHESLRTAIYFIEGKPVQVIYDDVNFKMEYYHKNKIVEKDEKIKSIIHDSFIRPFDLSQAPLMRVGLIKTGEKKYLLMIDMHHIVCDGVAFDIVIGDIAKLYEGVSLPALRIQYKDYALWQLQMMKSEKFKAKEAYWLKNLEGEIPFLDLPTDYPRPLIRGFEGSVYTFKIERELSNKIKKLSRENGTTLYMTLLAVYNLLLYRYTGQEDIIVGTPTAGRPHADLQKILGMFVNMLTMRSHPSGEKPFIQLLKEIKQNALDTYENQDFQFEELVIKLNLSRALNRNPLFDTVFALQNMDITETRAPGLSLKTYNFGERTAKFDISLYAYEIEDGTYFKFNYYSKLFNRQTIAQLSDHFINLLENAISNPDLKLSAIRVLSKAEENRLLYEFNNTAAEYPKTKTIHRLFEEQVEKTSDHIALVGADLLVCPRPVPPVRPVSLTYRQLNEQSDKLAGFLIEKGVLPDDIIGIMVERSLEMIVGLIGILKSGGAYLPIDPDFPQERIDYMLKDSGAKLVIGRAEKEGKAEERKSGKAEFVSSCFFPASQLPRFLASDSSNLAYIIYTSGTTGNPKGVLVEHKNVVRLMVNSRFQFDFRSSDIWTMFHSFNFDFSVWEMYGALLYGGKLIIIPRMMSRDPREFLKLLKREQVTILNQTPSAFYNLCEEEIKSDERELNIRYIIFGGEALRPVKLKKWRKVYPGTKLINMFGITETTVHVTYKEIGDKEIDLDISSIGVPIPTMTVYVVDRFLNLMPPGAAGELLVGWEGVSKGYLNRPELNAERFIPGVFRPNERIYRSGDLVRFLPDGELEYLGRIDQQVQLKGFRIEPGEIENQLLRFEGIREAVVIIKGSDGGEYTHLCAYIVSAESINIPNLREFLAQKLPDYMIPQYFIPLEKIPLTSNGKIDRARLPEPGFNIGGGEDYAAPINKIQEKLVEIWQKILQLEKVGIKDNYFQIGGDSIKAIALINTINKEFHSDLKIMHLYMNQTIEDLCVMLREKDIQQEDELADIYREMENLENRVKQMVKEPDNIEHVFPMSDIETGMIYHYLKDGGGVYHDQGIYHLISKHFDIQRMRKAIRLMMEKHAILRTGCIQEEFAHVVYKNVPVDIPYFEISHLEEADRVAFITRHMEESRNNHPFDIQVAPLWRMSFFNTGDNRTTLLWEFLHAIIDGWSNSSLLTELNNTYIELEDNPGYIPQKLKCGYKEYILQQMLEDREPRIADYWKKEFFEYKPLKFPEAMGKKKDRNKFLSMRKNLGVNRRQNLENLARQYNTSLKHLCFTAFVLMLNMLSYENDFVVGIVTNNRPLCEDGDKLIGCFLNTVPVRINVPAHTRRLDFILEIDKKMLTLKEYDRVSLLKIVKFLGEKTGEGNALFDSSFNLTDFYPYKQVKFEKDVEAKEFHVRSFERTNFSLNFTIDVLMGEFMIKFDYSEGVLDIYYAEKLIDYFKNILDQFIDNPEGIMDKEIIMSMKEKQVLLYEFNNTESLFPADKTIHELFEHRVQNAFDHTAVIFEDKRLTYNELSDKAGRLAHLLREKGVLPSTVVAIILKRSLDMIIGIFGILKAGGAYLPIDPEYPQERIDFMLKDSGAKLLAVANGLEGEKVRRWEGEKILLEETYKSQKSSSYPLTFLPSYLLSPRNLAYVIYTSGTTGKPKGVLIEHRSLVNRLNWMQKKYPLSQGDIILQKTTYTFDVSVWEIFWWSVVGAKVCLLIPGGEKDPEIITQTVARNHITTLHFVPSMLSVFLDYVDGSDNVKRLCSLKQVIASGEALLPAHVEQFNRLLNAVNGTLLANLYGPTEATVDVTSFDCNRGGEVKENGIIPIGKPIDNICLYIVDKHLHIQPIGVSGELCIAGIGLARGYLNRPELTCEKFKSKRSHRSNRTYISFYKTGDLARWLPDGNIEFLGRIDYQVKIRGFRIELGEIVTRLLAHEKIKEVEVIVKENLQKEKYLCAYFVAGEIVDISNLKEYLAETLPGYMIPAHFVQLEQMPLTPNGKLDRSVLPEPEMAYSDAYIAPRNQIERKLVSVWQKILGIENIGIRSNFFQLGGNSLNVISLISFIHRDFNIKPTVAEIFRNETIEKQGELIKISQPNPFAAIEPAPIKDGYFVSSVQRRLFFLQYVDPRNKSYNMPMVLNLEGEYELEKIENVFRQLIDRHESLRTSFHLDGDKLTQKIHYPGEVEFKIELSDLSPRFQLNEETHEHPATNQRDAAQEIIETFIRPFDLSRAPLFRVGIIYLHSLQSIVMIDIHHIVSDGISQAVFSREFMALYNNEQLPPLRIQYKDFAEWLNTEEQVMRIQQQEVYWLKRFSGELPLLQLPTDYDRPSTQTFVGDDFGFNLDDVLTVSLKEYAMETGATFFIILLALFNLTLSRLAGQEDIIIGTSLAGRRHSDLENIMGMFINALALRNYPSGNKCFRDFLQEVKQNTLEDFENQDYQFENLVENVLLERVPGRNPLFDVMMVLNNEEYPKVEIPGLKLGPYPYKRRAAQMDLKLRMMEGGAGLHCSLEYSTRLFKEESIRRLSGYFKRAAEAVLTDPGKKLAEIDILPEAEKQQLLLNFNSTEKAYPVVIPLHQLFQQQVAQTPDRIAVVAEGLQITYHELNQKSNSLSRLLLKNGTVRESVVGIMMEPSLHMIVGLLAILKSGGAYLPMDADLPTARALFMLEDARANILLTTGNVLANTSVSFTQLRNFQAKVPIQIVKTSKRSHIRDFDALPLPDRTLIDLSRYKDKIGMASVTRCMSLQATRGCPYECLFCHKVWSKKHAIRSAQNIFNEVEFYYKQGVRNFAVIDDCFNLNRENSSRFFQLVVKHKLDIQLFFPNGLRGDLLTPDYIDLMVEAGTRGINLSLETASPRLQQLLKKNLDIAKFKEVMDYIAARHPQVILEIATMHGFPTETEEEAMMTLDFIKSICWIHFPYIHILKIYPNTEMEALALEHGISREDIQASKDRAFHELPETLPFSKRFTREYQSDFMNNYFLSRERLKHVLPVQLHVMGERALVEKYDTYLPVKIKSLRDIIDFAKLDGFDCMAAGADNNAADNNVIAATAANSVNTQNIVDIFDREPQVKSEQQDPIAAKKILLLDLSQHFSSRSMLYNVVEQPLGLISLLTFLKQEFGTEITGKIFKSGVDFDSHAELKALIDIYQPDLVGIRTLTFYKEFFHETVSLLRQWGVTVPVIAGGPYATSDYETILTDRNVDLVVLGEGEYTMKELIRAMLDNGFKFPLVERLQEINGIVFKKSQSSTDAHDQHRTVLPVDWLAGIMDRNIGGEVGENAANTASAANLAYVMYTSGSTGTPKGVMVEHRQANNCIWWMQETFGFKGTDAIVQRTNLSFDPSVWEIFWPLSQGGKVKVLNTIQRKDAEYLVQLMAHPGDAVMMYCPATLVSGITYLLNNKTEKSELKLHWLIIGAEPISVDTVKMFYTYYKGKIVNTYGPTECAINNTYYELEPSDSRPIVPIGKPVANNKIYILSSHLQLMPLNVAGEICIAGGGVARGYIHNEEKTRACFIDNPFGPGKLYKTGDIGRWLDDGNIEIMGRADDQVKIRGHRIEPGEVEAALASHTSINKCLVIVRDNKKSQQDIRYCKRCGIGSNYPAVHINDDNNCEICENINKYKRFFDIYFKSLEDLRQSIRELNARVNTAERSAYDCLLLYSGGRGSAYALYQLVDMGFNVLTATYDNDYFSKKDLENIKHITASLGVDHVRLSHPKSSFILKESVESAHTVCRGCFHTSSSLGVAYAYQHHIPVVIGATLSRGQIIENKLFMFANQGITDVKKLEQEVISVQRSAPDIDREIFKLIDIEIVSDRSAYEKVTPLDFYRYCDITNEEMIGYLNNRDPYWKTRKNYAIYSTNCPIKQIGDFGHLKGAGFHYYGSATSWEKRLGHITMENLRDDLQCHVTQKGYENFLTRVGAVPKELTRRDEKYLTAYYVSDKEIESADLRAYLSGKLPPYMVPAYFVPLSEIPLTANGKVDKAKLPAPDFRMTGSRDFVKPETPVQETLAKVWGDVLAVPADRISLDDNFFELGGDSIKAIQITARLQEYKLKLEISHLFLNPTLRGTSQWATEIELITPLCPVEAKEYYPLSSSQRRFFIAQQINQENTAYNIPGNFTLLPGFNVEKLEPIFRELIRRHESLRTSFRIINNEPSQIIHKNVDFKIDYYDANGENAAKIAANFVRPFDLTSPPLFRVGLINTSQEKIVVVDMHHIISDGLSLQVLIRDFVALFEGRQLAPLPVQYKDYASWQNYLFKKNSFNKMERYWLDTLQNFKITKIPGDNYNRNERVRGASKYAVIGKDSFFKIEKFCTRYELTKFSFLLSIFLFILTNEIGENDLTIGTPIANRDHPNLENVIGVFLNVFLLRAKINMDDTIINNILTIKNNVIHAIKNSTYPYDELYYSLRNHYKLPDDEFFTILFNYLPPENKKEEEAPTKKAQTLSLSPFEITPKYLVTLYIAERNDTLVMNFVYRCDIYTKERIERIIRNYFKFIEAAVAHENTIVSNLVYGDEKNIDSIEEFNGEFENEDLF